MSVPQLKRRTTIATLAVAALVAGGAAAYGYPPMTKMSVEAYAANNGSQVVATAYNVSPNCDVQFAVNHGPSQLFTQHPHGTTVMVTFSGVSGLNAANRIDARAVNCTPKKDREHAHSSFGPNNSGVSGAATSSTGAKYVVSVTGLPKKSVVDFVATAPDGTTLTDQDKADKRGDATGTLRLNQVGTWSVVVTAKTPGGAATTIGTVTVNVS
jgi:hypothetical protein